MKRLPWKYIAGFIDGEGCFDVQMVKGEYVRPRLRITQAESGKMILYMLQNSFGGTISKRESKNENWQDSYEWALVGYSQVNPFINQVVKYLYIKHEQARLIQWMETNLKGKHNAPEVREAVREELKAMKRDPHRLSEKAALRIGLML